MKPSDRCRVPKREQVIDLPFQILFGVAKIRRGLQGTTLDPSTNRFCRIGAMTPSGVMALEITESSTQAEPHTVSSQTIYKKTHPSGLRER